MAMTFIGLLLVVVMAQAMPVKVLSHLHCSDIPGDDGQKTLQFLAQKAVNEGYGAIIITPHSDSNENNSLAINGLIDNLPNNLSLTIIVGKEVNESGVHVLRFGGVRCWAHPGYPVANATPQTPCQFYEAFNARVAQTVGTNVFLTPPGLNGMKPLVGEDWHGDYVTPFHIAIIVEAENKSAAAIMTALRAGNYTLSVDNEDVTAQVARLAEEFE